MANSLLNSNILKVILNNHKKYNRKYYHSICQELLHQQVVRPDDSNMKRLFSLLVGEYQNFINIEEIEL